MHLQTKTAAQGHPVQRSVREKTDSLLALLVFQLLFFGNVGFHLGLCPALQIGLAVTGDAQCLCGHVLGDGAAGGGVGTIAHIHGG